MTWKAVREKLGTILGITVFLIFIGGGLFLSSDTAETIPHYASVIWDTKTGEYYSPIYVFHENKQLFKEMEKDYNLSRQNNTPRRYEPIPYSEAKVFGLKRNEDCYRKGYFSGATQNTFLHWLSQYGLWFKWQSRWNEDGSWNW
ncbi:MAG: hypothetical protein IJR68_06565 [Fretibacterium sp.]|nr:hypothetical protein [Fretibacterium sp.]